MFFTCGWSARMPVSNTPILTAWPKKPAPHRRSAENIAVTEVLACSVRMAALTLLAVPRSLSMPKEGLVSSL